MEEKELFKIQIKHKILGSVLFEYEKEENTIKDTLQAAVKAGADLRDADLGGADLRRADLRGADLRDADLGGADLRDADLRDADLGGADLRRADLRGADLRRADLGGADLRGADLGGADLGGAKNIPYIPLACPSDGAFIGWKKARSGGYAALVKIEIPEDAKRSSATGTKCRCDKARVLEITRIADGKQSQEATSDHDLNFIYRVGEMVSVDDFDENPYNECAPGIHFFINRQEAINY